MAMTRRKDYELRILTALCEHSNEWMTCAGENSLARRSGVPKGQIRRTIDGHPEVSIRKVGDKYQYRYRMSRALGTKPEA